MLCRVLICLEHIALDVIRQVGPKGEFISTDHTLNFFRKEHWQPKLCNRFTLDSWMDKGSKTWGELSIHKAIEILETHRPEPLPEHAQQILNEIRAEAEVSLQAKHFEV